MTFAAARITARAGAGSPASAEGQTPELPSPAQSPSAPAYVSKKTMLAESDSGRSTA